MAEIRKSAGMKMCHRTKVISFHPDDTAAIKQLGETRMSRMDFGCFRHFYATGFYLK